MFAESDSAPLAHRGSTLAVDTAKCDPTCSENDTCAASSTGLSKSCQLYMHHRGFTAKAGGPRSCARRVVLYNKQARSHEGCYAKRQAARLLFCIIHKHVLILLLAGDRGPDGVLTG